jgi:TolB-like protein
VAVPLFENQTPEFGLAENLTQGVITGFMDDNQIKVVDTRTAEAVLSGRIVDYKRKAYTFDETDQVSEYMVEISVSAELVKRATPDTVWTMDRTRGSGIYTAEGEEEKQGQERAIAKIAEDILNRTIRSW